MSAGSIRPFVIKELRALMPIWVASAAAIAAAVLSGPRNHELGLLAYGFGSVTLGAQSIGHEYTNRTLTLLLSQPVSRRWLLTLKLAVATVMLLTLAAFAWLTLLQPGDEAWVFLSLLNALCLAPLLTMACRTPVAGVVFTGAAPFWIQAIGGYVSAGVLWGTTLTLSAVAAVAGWRRFTRLEAIDGRGSDLELPRLFRSTASMATPASALAARRPLWRLVNKELHLQQMTFAVAAVWLVIWGTVFRLAPIVPMFATFPLEVVSALFGVLLPLLIGALASAEERQLGTLEWQMLQPLAAWQQWTVKVGTVIVLAELLSFALPVMFAAGQSGWSGWHAAGILVLTIGSLYVSSLCRNSIRALTIAAPIMLALIVVWTYAAGIYSIGYRGEHLRALTVVPLTAVVALMLRFGLENHRTTAQGVGRVTRQVLWMVASVALGVAAVTAVS